MRKLLFTLSVFFISFIGCDYDHSIAYEEIKSDEINIKNSSFNYINLVKGKDNLNEILLFLSISKLEDAELTEYFPDGWKDGDSFLISLSKFMFESYKSALLLINPTTNEIWLLSFFEKTNNSTGSIIISNFDSKELLTDELIIEYNYNEQKALLTILQKSGGSENWNQCMRRKLSAIFVDGNWVDQAQFIIGVPASYFWLVGSCGWNTWFSS